MLPGPLIPQIAPGYYSTRETIAHNFALQAANPRTIALKAIRQPDERHIPGSKRPRKPASQRKKPPPDRCAFCACGSDGGFCGKQLLGEGRGKLGGFTTEARKGFDAGTGGDQPRQAGHKARGFALAALFKPQQLPHQRKRNPFTRGSASRRAAAPGPGPLPRRQQRQGLRGRKRGTRGCR